MSYGAMLTVSRLYFRKFDKTNISAIVIGGALKRSAAMSSGELEIRHFYDNIGHRDIIDLKTLAVVGSLIHCRMPLRAAWEGREQQGRPP